MKTDVHGLCDYREALALQDAFLQGVSRTFALTIPQLPEGLRRVVGNAYLLCRIADTIEDSRALTIEQKRRFYDEFVAVVAGQAGAEPFAEELAPLLAGDTLQAERDLIRHTAEVIGITRTFASAQQAALSRCVRIMSEGMEAFQEGRFAHGLRDQEHLDSYCYHVAGVVGEMLTDLFCAFSPEVAKQRDGLQRLAVSFGEGLQMTNILKDIWDDKQRNVCWLPQDVFAQEGFRLNDLARGDNGPGFRTALGTLIAVARGHLDNALEYTLLIPKSEKGIRTFCLWAIGMAVLTLRKIQRRPNFTSGDQVKISRRSVRATILATRTLGWSNPLLRMAFRLIASGLPRPPLRTRQPSV